MLQAEAASEEGEIIDEAAESSKITAKTVLKWANYLFQGYTVIDMVGRKIYDLIHGKTSESAPKLTETEKQEIERLYDTTQQMQMVFGEMQKTMKILKPCDLGSIERGETDCNVSYILQEFLSQINQVI